MVITGIVLGVYFFLQSTTEIVKKTYEFKKEDGESVKEDVSADVKENYVQYHLKDDDSEVWVIDDFNRELQLMKVTDDGGTSCFILPLNASDNAMPNAVLNASSPRDGVESEKVNYQLSESAIKDKSILGAHGQKLCKNIDVHWMIPSCEDASNPDETKTEVGRQKRRICVRYYYRYRCYYRLYCSWGRCYWRRTCYYWYLYRRYYRC